MNSSNEDVLFGNRPEFSLDSIKLFSSQDSITALPINIFREYSYILFTLQEGLEYYLTFNSENIDTISATFGSEPARCCKNNYGVVSLFYNGIQVDCEGYICATQAVVFNRR